MSSFYRVAAFTPTVTVANPIANAKAIIDGIEAARAKGAKLYVTPALSLTGATCGDLFRVASLERHILTAIEMITQTLLESEVCVVGLPLRIHDRLYNCAAVLTQNEILGIVPKQQLSQRAESEEARYFTPGTLAPNVTLFETALVDAHQLFSVGSFTFAVDLSDLWSTQPTATMLAAGRAQLLLHLDASPMVIGRAAAVETMVQANAARWACPYVYCNAGLGESTTDNVYSGQVVMANNGRLLVTSQWTTDVQLMDFNPRWVDYVRMRESDFANLPTEQLLVCECLELAMEASDGAYAGLEANPFVPQDAQTLAQRCNEILLLQTAALRKRFEHTHAKRLVIGLSGGLDSTLALLVCARMAEVCGLPPTAILGVTMPGFGTSKRTRSNVDVLAEELGIELREIPIAPGVEQHFKDIGHDPDVKDVTYENAQARARTYLLMDLANQENGLLVGTGDLSEIALGWSTYNGDHMSMYSVNCDVPKLLVRHCVQWVAQHSQPALAKALQDICDTPVSPELLPGEQHTESIVGSYELHDFFLYYFFKYGCDQEELASLATLLHGETYSEEVRTRTLEIFCRRFVQQQFKRSASPDGPKVGTVALSPRGDWHMPSDAAFHF